MSDQQRGTALYRAARRSGVCRLANAQGGVVGRRQLFALGLTRHELDAELRSGRWQRLGRQTVRVLPSTDPSGDWWRCLFEVGSAAVLDGVTALLAAGLQAVDSPGVHVAVPKSARRHRSRNVYVHETRRFCEDDVIRVGIPRVRPATAVVHAVLWARSASQGALFVVAAVQQEIVDPADFAVEVARIRRHPRRALLRALVGDVQGGIESTGEREFDRLCRRRGFPAPTRQVVRRSPTGRVFLDVYWERYRVTVEIDGIQHVHLDALIHDSLKQNAMTLDGDTVLRVPVVALRVDPEPFLDQVEAALRRGGWPGR
jgi:very-short-patch-repair endonuclease